MNTRCRLPSKPPRGNYAGSDFLRGDEDVDLPHHLIPCASDQHDAVCSECWCWITIGTEGTEYGHARANNRDHKTREERGACKHRPDKCNPQGRGQA